MKVTIEDVKIIRKKVRMKQYVLAEMLNIEQSNYANMENGKLITNKLPDIIHNALSILIPKLEKEILMTKSDYEYLKSLRSKFKNY